MTINDPTAILATTGIGSQLRGHRALIQALESVGRRQALVLDVGMIGETGFFRLGAGQAERAILRELYDLVLPSGPGFALYRQDPALRAMSVCANLRESDATSAFHPAARVRVAGVDTLIVGVLGPEQFAALPAAGRGRLYWHPPGPLIRELAARFAHRPRPARRSAIVVLSDSDPQRDQDLAAQCPEISAIIARNGADEAPRSGGPAGIAVIGAPPGGAGYALLHPTLSGYEAETIALNASPSLAPGRFEALHRQIDTLTAALDTPVARLPAGAGAAPVHGPGLLARLADALVRTDPRIYQVLLPACALRDLPAGEQITRGHLLEATAAHTRLVLIELNWTLADALCARLLAQFGPLVKAGRFPAVGPLRLATTASIAVTCQGARELADLGELTDHIASLLNAPESAMAT